MALAESYDVSKIFEIQDVDSVDSCRDVFLRLCFNLYLGLHQPLDNGKIWVCNHLIHDESL